MNETAAIEVMSVKEITVKHGLERMKWLARALDVDDARTCMGAIHVKDKYAFASDGHRFHIAHDEMFGSYIPEGDWEVIRNGRKEMVLRENDKMQWREDYKLKNILPDCSEYKNIELSDSERTVKGRTFAEFMRKYPHMIDLDYFNDLFPIAEGNSRWNLGRTETMTFYYSETDNSAAVVAHGNGYVGILMPVIV